MRARGVQSTKADRSIITQRNRRKTASNWYFFMREPGPVTVFILACPQVCWQVLYWSVSRFVNRFSTGLSLAVPNLNCMLGVVKGLGNGWVGGNFQDCFRRGVGLYAMVCATFSCHTYFCWICIPAIYGRHCPVLYVFLLGGWVSWTGATVFPVLKHNGTSSEGWYPIRQWSTPFSYCLYLLLSGVRGHNNWVRLGRRYGDVQWVRTLGPGTMRVRYGYGTGRVYEYGTGTGTVRVRYTYRL